MMREMAWRRRCGGATRQDARFSARRAYQPARAATSGGWLSSIDR